MTEKANWLSEQLQEYAREPRGSIEDPPLLTVSTQLKRGELDGVEYCKYQAATLEYIENCLGKRPRREEEAFLKFLVYSEVSDVSMEIRNALHLTLTNRFSSPTDWLCLEILSVLLRSPKPPSSNLGPKFIPAIRAQHRMSPAWQYVVILVALADKAPNVDYDAQALVDDIALLEKTPDFERALRTKHPLWINSRFRLDSISLYQQIKRKDIDSMRNFPAPAELGLKVRGIENEVVLN
jgi:hypothetical protein